MKKLFIKDTVAFRPTPEAMEVLNTIAEELQTNNKALVLNTAVCRSLQTSVNVLELQEENTRLKFELGEWEKTKDFVDKGEKQRIRFLTIYKMIEPLKTELSAAFKSLFNDADCPEVTTEQTIEMMLDYCQRDPSQEFPFKPVARKIYNELKKPSENGQSTETA